MRKHLGKLLMFVAVLASGAASLGCPWWTGDEPVANDDLCD